MGPRNKFQGINSASLCSLAGRYDNPIPPRFLTPIRFLKIPAQGTDKSLSFSALQALYSSDLTASYHSHDLYNTLTDSIGILTTCTGTFFAFMEAYGDCVQKSVQYKYFVTLQSTIHNFAD